MKDRHVLALSLALATFVFVVILSYLLVTGFSTQAHQIKALKQRCDLIDQNVWHLRKAQQSVVDWIEIENGRNVREAAVLPAPQRRSRRRPVAGGPLSGAPPSGVPPSPPG